MPPLGQTDRWRQNVLGLSVCSFVCNQMVSAIFWKRVNQFWCQLAQMVHRAVAWNVQLWESRGQRSR